jgi:hypothetical protein
MDNSVKSAIGELKSDCIANQERNLDFAEQLDHLGVLAERNNTVFGGSDECERFNEVKTVITGFYFITRAGFRPAIPA